MIYDMLIDKGLKSSSLAYSFASGKNILIGNHINLVVEPCDIAFGLS